MRAPLEREARIHQDAEREALLRDMISSLGWRDVARPALARALEQLKVSLAVNSRLDLEEVRRLQARYALLYLLYADPVEFFLAALGPDETPVREV